MTMLRFAALGDISFNDKLSDFLNIQPPTNFLNPNGLFSNCDFLVGNLESPLVKDSKVAIKKKIYLSGNPVAAKYLAKNKINILSLANNHIFDYGLDGYYETIETLKSNNIGYFGAGKNIEEASQPYIKILNSYKIGFLGYCAPSTHAKIAAKRDYGVSPFILEKCILDIKNLINFVNFIIVSIHWGYERFRLPSPSQIKTAHQLIDAGCNLILGHHPHIIQAYEKYNGGYIFYSLGNYLFSDIYNKEGIKISCQTEEDNIYSLVPLISVDSRNGRVNVNPFITKIYRGFKIKLVKNQEFLSYYDMFKKWQSLIRLDSYFKIWKKYKIKNLFRELFNKKSLNYYVKNFYKLRPYHREIILKYFRQK